MNTPLTRKDFLAQSLFATAGIATAPNLLFAEKIAQQQEAAKQEKPKQERPKPIALDVVNEFVKVAHSDFGKVKQMLEEYPLLLNAAWDWGGGDFETALGAAGHMGLREEALYLIEKGARADIFVLAMLGKTDIVKAMLKEYPTLLHSAGPHGFTLLHHAEKAGKEGEELVNHLQMLGLKEKNRKLYK